MIAFVESNFVLEIALRQEQEQDATEILKLAEAKKISLFVPACSLVEPFHKLGRDQQDRKSLRSSVIGQVEQMARSADFSTIRQQSNDFLAALARKSDVDAASFTETSDRIRACSTVLPLTSDVIGAASGFQLGLKPQDALVFATIEMQLKAGAQTGSVFANRDAKGFLEKPVSDRLVALKCIVIPNFVDALAYIRARS